MYAWPCPMFFPCFLSCHSKCHPATSSSIYIDRISCPSFLLLLPSLFFPIRKERMNILPLASFIYQIHFTFRVKHGIKFSLAFICLLLSNFIRYFKNFPIVLLSSKWSQADNNTFFFLKVVIIEPLNIWMDSFNCSSI